MNQTKCGKFSSGEFFIGEVVEDSDVIRFKNLCTILISPTDEDARIRLGVVPINPFGQRDEILEVPKTHVMFYIDEIPDVITNQYNQMTSNIVIPKPETPPDLKLV